MKQETIRGTAAAWLALCAFSCLITMSCGSSKREPVRSPPDQVGGGTAEAASPSEEKVLERLGEMPASKQQTVGDLSVVAEPPYSAASGRTCRRVTLTTGKNEKTSRTRLACSDGEKWQYVPDVFLAPSGP